ncbi:MULTISPECIES: dihydroorotate dehydrogenase electron transfer subunit [Bacillaceae]|uniref:Dihydroorotate dehydrogenase B (NAD(+)), electron transfer subunit n=1 Tax=Evansella alkalicola TaxID=745819 RepID=A0ABS6JPQ1_9BACI|nr:MULTISPECIES: dihydroorotate dehydrogenase electron transfer subunit [Bacillaceae]MBU9720415.1 dihydroorotate dehydrogenase electron transfer subunit [Bacillus alkalicola]
MRTEDMKITEQKEVAPKIFKVTLSGELAIALKSPGQFIHVQVDKGIDPMLRRPLSICDVNLEKEELTLIYRVEGKGTKLLSEKNIGDSVNVLGPLGEGFPIENVKENDTCLLVGGGVGIPPLYYLAKKLTNKGAKVITILGFRNAGDIFLEEEFAQLGEVIITTEDGSKGIKGFVTNAFKGLSYDVFYTCGPKGMLRAVESEAVTAGFISLEERMGCGVGACLACVCDYTEPNTETGKTYAKICSDGPVFKAGEVRI